MQFAQETENEKEIKKKVTLVIQTSVYGVVFQMGEPLASCQEAYESLFSQYFSFRPLNASKTISNLRSSVTIGYSQLTANLGQSLSESALTEYEFNDPKKIIFRGLPFPYAKKATAKLPAQCVCMCVMSTDVPDIEFKIQ